MVNRSYKKSNYNSFRNGYIYNPKTAFYALALFIIIIFLGGGGSRDDIQSLIILRPIAVLICGYALIYKIEKQISWVVFPFIILLSLATLMVIQLIPLPPEIWSKLPERQLFADIAIVANIEQPWRPISLSPSKTWNSLFSLTVPLAIAMAFMNIEPKDRKKIVFLIMLLIGLSALLAMLQTLGGSRGPLYFYQVTNNGSAVGLFANRNHQSIMLAILILFLGWYSSITHQQNFNPFNISLALGAIFTLIPLILITGSRAGLILMLPALFGSLYFMSDIMKSKKFTAVGYKSRQKSPIVSNRVKVRRSTFREAIKSNKPKILSATVVASIIIIAATSVIFSRSLAFDRLFPDGNIDDFRAKVTPILIDIMSKYFPFGSGFGSFEHIYKIYEPVNLLSPLYFNQAHNDWLQFIIEGGLPALLIIIVILYWIMRNIWSLVVLLKHGSLSKIGKDKNTILMCLIYFVLMGAASIGDYPLRVPSIMTISTIIMIIFQLKINEIVR